MADTTKKDAKEEKKDEKKAKDEAKDQDLVGNICHIFVLSNDNKIINLNEFVLHKKPNVSFSIVIFIVNGGWGLDFLTT